MKRELKTPADLENVINELFEKIDSLEGNPDNAEEIEQTRAEMRMLRGEFKRAYKARSGNATDHPDKAAFHKRIGELFKAIATGNNERIQEFGARAGSIESTVEKADLGTPLTGDAVTGSYLTDQEYLNEILHLATEESDVMPRVRKWKMTSRVGLYPRKNAGLSLTKIATDGDVLTEISPTFQQGTLTARTYAGWIGMSEALLEDDITQLGAYIAEQAGEASAVTFDTEMLTSTSAPTGLLANGSVGTTRMGSGEISFDDVGIANLRTMEKDISETRGALKNAVYLMSPYMWQQLRDEVNAQGDPLVAAWIEQAPRRLNGRDVVLSYQMPDSSDSAADTAVIALGDPKNLIWGDRLALEVKFFPETRYAVEYAEVFFRIRVRWGFDVALPSGFQILKTAVS